MTTGIYRNPNVAARDRRYRDSLALYLDAVRRELTRRRVVVREAHVRAPEPGEALCATLSYGLPDWPTTVRAGWHEELGWWAEQGHRHERRYLTGNLVPPTSTVADFLTLGGEPGSLDPKVHRYRLLGDEPELIARLDRFAGADRG